MKKNLLLGLLAMLCIGCARTESPKIETYTISRDGMEVTVTNVGGRIMKLLVPDQDGAMRDVVLGFDEPEQYLRENNLTDFGASIGRYANRIQYGELVLDGDTFQLPQNNFGHCLHGGPTGWQYQLYELVEKCDTALTLKIVSPDGDNGFPGEVTAYVTFSLPEGGQLRIDYQATTTKTTVVNMTNHSYFNLAGDPNHDITTDVLIVNADAYTPVDSTLIPTTLAAPVEGTMFDFREERMVENDLDHNFVLNERVDMYEAPAAVLICEESGIIMACYTTEPGIQVYTGNFLDGSLTGKGGVAIPKHAGICLETQHYPDSPHHSDWPSTVLRPGETYESTTIYQFYSVELYD